MHAFDYELTELHTHVGSSVSPEIMWGLAHSQGIKVKGKDYWSFVDLITVHPEKIKNLDDYVKLFDITELIQSSPEAMEASAYSIVGGAYRKNLITRLELRFNPMKRNRGGERDLDHIILATIRGMERAMLEYPVRAGLIIMFDRTFSPKQNEVLLEKAIKYKNRGIIGIDVGGAHSEKFVMESLAPLYEKAAKAGLGLTAHAGEDRIDDVSAVIDSLHVSRIGHGVRAADDPALLRKIRDADVTLEVCPSSNLNTRVVRDKAHLKNVLETFLKEEIKFTINTDGPEMLNTSLRKERALLLSEGMLTEEQLKQCEEWARKATFLN